jgi:hypothetical protein
MKKTVYQLAKLSRRLPRLVSRLSLRLQKKGLPQPEVQRTMARIVGCHQALELLKQECKNRRIGLPGLRDTRPLRLQKLGGVA